MNICLVPQVRPSFGLTWDQKDSWKYVRLGYIC
jgi:hypothetical protein